MDYELIGFIKASKHRQDILLIIKKEPSTPREIADKLNIHISQVSRTIGEMVDMKLIEIMNPNMKKGRIYSITPIGLECLNR
jgi:predicted transcriptional regulator